MSTEERALMNTEQSLPVPLGTPADDGKALVYDAESESLSYSDVAGVGGYSIIGDDSTVLTGD